MPPQARRPGSSLKWHILVYGLLGLVFCYLLIRLNENIPALNRVSEMLNQRGPSSVADALRGFDRPNVANPFDLSLIARRLWIGISFDLWALAATAGLILLRANPFGWIGARQMIWGSLALAVLLGRSALGFLVPLLAFIPIPGTLFFLLAPVVLFFVGLAFIGLVGMVCLLVLTMTVAAPLVLFNSIFQFERNVAEFRQHQGFLADRLLRFYFWFTGEEPPAQLPDDSKGARFATPLEAAQLIQPEGMGFGHVVGGTPPRRALLRLLTDKHILITASTRSGKGAALLIPHLLRYEGSAFVLDPKGENAKATYRHRSTINDKVHVLDPFGITGKPQARFNPLSRFTPINMEAESKALAAAFVLGKRDHWTASAQQLLAAIILYVYASPEFPPETKDLPTVRRLLLGAADATLAAMAQTDLANGLVADLARSFISTPERERGSIISSAQRETEILDNPFIVACLSATGPGEEVDFAAWHRGTMTVYLCLAAPKFPVFNRWLRLVLTSALDEMTETLRPPPRPVCFMLDELATLGRLEPVENAIGLSAGYGIQLITVWQDVAQMRNLYQTRWASFISNSGIRALFNLDDYETAHYWSDTIGGREVQTSSQQLDTLGYVQGQSQGATIRPLLTADQLMLNYAAGKMLILVQGARPIEALRTAYFRDAELNGLWDDPRVEVPPPAAPSVNRPPLPVHAAAPPREPMPDVEDDEEELPPPI